MAQTVIGPNDPQAVKRWSLMLTREAIGRTWLNRFMGTSPSSFIQLHRDLRRQRGDQIKVDLLMQLTSYGVIGEALLKGNEEALVYHQHEVNIDQVRQGINYGSMTQQRTIHNMRRDGMNNLADFYARLFDKSLLALLAGTAGSDTDLGTFLGNFGGTDLVAPSASHFVDKTGSGTFDIDYLTVLREMAKTGPGGNPIIRPFRTQDGEDIYGIVLHPYQITSIKTQVGPSKWTEVNANAQVRGNRNPIFTGAVGMWDGVVIYESVYTPRTTTGDVNHGIFMGAQAGHIAFGQPYRSLGRTTDVGTQQELFTYMEDVDDYGERTGVAGASIFGMTKSRYNDVDYATIRIDTADAPQA